MLSGLRARLEGRLEILAGDVGFERSVRILDTDRDVVLLRNVYLVGRRLLWQRGCVRRLLRPDVVVLELNPRTLSSWAILLLRRARRKRTIAWGHAWPRSGEDARTDRIRHAMRRLANGVVVYTDTQAAALSRRMPDADIRSAPNGLYPARLAVHDTRSEAARDVLFVGRLVPAKKPALALQGFVRALPELPAETRLVFVGDGELRSDLQREVEVAEAFDRVRFAGTVSGFDELAEMYRHALVSLSPGYVGLSLVQSLWFGVPMIIARDEPHAPEIEAAREGHNSILVASDSVELLARALLDVFRDRENWLARGPTIARECVERYSLESTINALADAIEADRR